MEIRNSIKDKIIKLNKKKVKCPTCKKHSIVPFVPFCSKECSDIDLMKWITDENYIKLKSK